MGRNGNRDEARIILDALSSAFSETLPGSAEAAERGAKEFRNSSAAAARSESVVRESLGRAKMGLWTGCRTLFSGFATRRPVAGSKPLAISASISIS